MDEEGFEQWLVNSGLADDSIRTQLWMVRRIETVLPQLGIAAADLDAAFALDSLEGVSSALESLKQDARAGGTRFRILFPESENPSNRLTNAKSWIRKYRSFREGPNPNESQADRIREYVLETYIVPAREGGQASVTVKVGDVNDALSLGHNWRNVFQALSGSKFQELAEVPVPTQEGVNDSPATRLTFDLSAEEFTIDLVESELAQRYGEAIQETKKILAFQTADGREIALDRDASPAQLWVEASGAIPDGFEPRFYAPSQSRHSNLPPRLKHQPPKGEQPRRVAVVRPRSVVQLRELLDWYAKPTLLNRDRLEKLKEAFLKIHPDFEPAAFAATSGKYFKDEREYKDALIRRAQEALVSLVGEDEATLGGRLLDVLTGQAGAPSNLLDWRLRDRLKALRMEFPGELEREAGRLARSDDTSAAISGFVSATWSMLSKDQKSKPYSESRNVPTMLAALAHPTRAYPINTEPVLRVARHLTGDQIMGWNPMTADEYAKVLALMRAIEDVMASEWKWAPRDLWDVQGFIWVLHKSNSIPKVADEEEPAVMNLRPEPTNLILYGPPGTGKTYATAREAVLLCNNSSAPASREELMAEYAVLAAAGRIEFVTFHQSYSYEEFIEGLRPVHGESGSPGFSLAPEMGIFRRIARRAETSTGPGIGSVSIEGRQVFKMSIGEAFNPEEAHLFEEALAGGFTLLGYVDIDFSDSRFESREAIIQACREKEPSEPEPTALSARVQGPFTFRNGMQKGDVVVVSKGNKLFRAIGVVTGGYEYAPRADGTYSHRRSIDWLWHDQAGVPVEEIYARGFSQKGIYILTPEELNIPALERYIASQRQSAGGTPEQFVLIIDEINRANISKVFGELITLLEADKRLGAENEIRIRLPYSRELFGIPANLHIVGTMNTADRSIALLDTALRRRFKFRELMPDPNALTDASAASGIDLGALLSGMNQRIEYLFDREHQIGHAYFMKCQSRSDVDEVMRDRVIPLLSEYFYDDWAKVAMVLGDSDGAGHFLERNALKSPSGFDADDGTEPRYRWIVKSAFSNTCYAQFQ